jgi:hypothetical protein
MGKKETQQLEDKKIHNDFGDQDEEGLLYGRTWCIKAQSAEGFEGASVVTWFFFFGSS